MTTFNTGNPLGSTDVYDRYDNSENLDNFSNGPLDAYPDRFGVSRQSLQGIRNASQYVILGAYAAGLNFTAQNQVFSYLGEFYAPGPSIVLPYTTTGVGAAEIETFRSVGDAILRSDLASGGGSQLVGYMADGAGAVVRRAKEKLGDAVSVRDFGAVGGGADDTAAIQAAVNYGILTGAPVCGGGGMYQGGGITIATGLHLQNISITNNKNADHVSVLQTADGVALFDVLLANVHIDGSRSTQTNIIAAAEDGGRHALAIRGECDGITLRDSSFNNSAGDGLIIFPMGVAGSYVVRNILIDNCAFNGNRRHGISADRVDGLHLANVKMNGNGIDSAAGYADNHGNTGNKSGGQYYGNGIDVEEYATAYGSKNITFENCEGLNNARGGILILRNNTAGISTEFGGYRIIGGKYNKGFFTTTSSSIEITPNTASPAGVCFGSARIIGADIGDGNVTIRAANAYITGLKYTAATAINALDFSTVTTDITETYLAASATLLKITGLPHQYLFGPTGISRGLATAPNVVDSVYTAQYTGSSYSLLAKDAGGNMRGGYTLEHDGSGYMPFSVYGGVGGSKVTYFVSGTDSTRPGADNAMALGNPSFRWSTVYAATATISTSDERSKQQLQPIDAAVLRAWANVEYAQYKFNDSVTEKGDNARWHFGIIAQRVQEAFENEGLDAFAYGVLCYDEWEGTPEVIEARDEAGIITTYGQAGIPAGNRYGIRYEEALALECAYLRSRIDGITA